MRGILITCMLALIAAVVLVLAIKNYPSYVLISFGHWTLETSVWFAAALLLVLLFFAYLLLALFRNFFSHGTNLKRWFHGRKYNRSQVQTTQGLIAFIEGNWQRSLTSLSRSAEKSETPLLNYLVAARASSRLGDEEKTQEFLYKAEKSDSQASIAVELTQAELQLQSGRFKEALATLTRLKRNAGKHPYVLQLLLKAYQGLNDWQGLSDLMPLLGKYDVISSQELDAMAISVVRARLEEIAGAKDCSAMAMTAEWKKLPKTLRRNSELLACYVRGLMAAGEHSMAEKLLRDQLKRDWQKDLLALYGFVETVDSNKQLLHAEGWLRERNNDPALLLCLGRLSLRNELWGKARDYLESSLKLEDNASACAELGRLLANLGEHEKSNNYFQRGSLLSAEILPELPMPPRP